MILKKIILRKVKELRKKPDLGKPFVGNLRGLWSLRVGKHRAIYQILKKN